MTPPVKRIMTAEKILVKDLNPCITCSLCRGYFVDATSLVDCLHVFCRACILRYFENFKLACPTCNVVYKKKSNPCFRSDPITQALVYKVVPGLYSKEVQRREDFYRSTGVRASSSCSEDSVLGDLNEEHDEWVLSTCGDQNQYLSPDDAISLSLEYYQPHLDTTQNPPSNTNSTNSQDLPETKSDQTPSDLNNSSKLSAEKTQNCDNNKINNAGVGSENSDQLKSDSGKYVSSVMEVDGKDKTISENENDSLGKRGSDRRYLQCPAAVTMSHLQKFVRMKYALSSEHRVDIIHSGEVLPSHFSLMDVAYTFKWQRTKPMRFFYRIFTPAKIQPIKIISTSSLGGKQLQVVPAKPNPTQTLQTTDSKTEATKNSLLKGETDAQSSRNKERLMANLQLQSKTKLLERVTTETANSKKEEKRSLNTDRPKSGRLPEEEVDCVYEYEEPDKDEIRAFAEKRDREWALQKQLDEEKEKHRTSKKRKKSKHSKSNLLYKKRKLHAEITSSEEKDESLKLKVKITPHNGYKHKHHKSSQNQLAESAPKQAEMSSKEKLLQMRQVRHKHISAEDKGKSLCQNNNSSPHHAEESVEKPTKHKDDAKNSDSIKPDKHKSSEPNVKIFEPPKKTPEPAVSSKPTQSSVKAESTKPNLKEFPKPSLKESPKLSLKESPKPSLKDSPKPSLKESPRPSLKESPTSGKTLRSDFANKTNATKELCLQKYPTVQLERNEQTERQAQKTFLKTFQSYTEKLPQNTEKAPILPRTARLPPPNTYPAKNHQNTQTSKSLEQKIANLHQQCTTVDVKPVVRQEASKVDKKAIIVTEKPQILNSQYVSGFTVSKVEAGNKRKLENDHNLQEKRPSLEITLVNPQPPEKSVEIKAVVKRPPPPTIPLDRIKKSINRMSGISIIPKVSDRCDNTGALDLSKPSKSMEIIAKPAEVQNKVLNGLSMVPRRPPERVQTPDKNIQLSNLQMLSKVATEHPNINKTPNMVANKRPQMPNLQTLKIPVPQNSSIKSNLPKLPKLNEINKMQFRMPNPQLRNMRPNQNQSVRNIPNPSLLVRQQNQNRLNSLNCNQNSSDVKEHPKLSSSIEGTSSAKDEVKGKMVGDGKEQNKIGIKPPNS